MHIIQASKVILGHGVTPAILLNMSKPEGQGPPRPTRDHHQRPFWGISCIHPRYSLANMTVTSTFNQPSPPHLKLSNSSQGDQTSNPIEIKMYQLENRSIHTISSGMYSILWSKMSWLTRGWVTQTRLAHDSSKAPLRFVQEVYSLNFMLNKRAFYFM